MQHRKCELFVYSLYLDWSYTVKPVLCGNLSTAENFYGPFENMCILHVPKAETVMQKGFVFFFLSFCMNFFGNVEKFHLNFKKLIPTTPSHVKKIYWSYLMVSNKGGSLM